MTKKSILINLDSELFDSLKKRVEKEYLRVDEMAENIIRRSMISYKGNASKTSPKIDDKLVAVFSRDKRGRKKKPKKK